MTVKNICKFRNVSNVSCRRNKDLICKIFVFESLSVGAAAPTILILGTFLTQHILTRHVMRFLCLYFYQLGKTLNRLHLFGGKDVIYSQDLGYSILGLRILNPGNLVLGLRFKDPES